MTADVHICPDCRARVFGDWQTCKFCGAVLRAERIGATVDPDELQAASRPSGTDDAPAPESAVPGALEPRTARAQDWSSWANDPEPWAAEPRSEPESWTNDPDPWATGPNSWADHPGPGTADPGSASLVPLEGAEPTWAPGPAPAVSTDPDADPGRFPSGAEPASGPASSWDVDETPSGLDPMPWYPEPGSTPASEPPGHEPAAPSSNWGAPVTSGPATATATFDPNALFGDPEPPASRNDPGTDESPSAGTSVPVRAQPQSVNWEPAAADAWDALVEPEGKPKRQAVLSRESRLTLAAIVLVLFVLAAGALLKDRDAGHPTVWASNVEEVANWVADTRNVPFAHPVAVATVNQQDFDAAVAQASLPDDERARDELATQVAMWRALGAVQGSPKNSLPAISAQRPELGAFFDLDGRRLVVRDGADPDQVRVGLAGALSVALDDQRADLKSLTSTSIDENPRFDVVLGTAARMRAEFARTHELDVVDGTGMPGGTGTTATPAFSEARAGLQSRLGAPFTQMVRDVDGSETLDGLVGSPPVSSQQVLNPTAFFDGRGPLAVTQPEVPDGADELDDGTLGAQTWYLLLAGHLQDEDGVDGALEFADRWAGDAFVAYRKADGQVCVTDVLRGSDDSQTGLLLSKLHTWRTSLGGGHVDVDAKGSGSVEVTACDPGPTAGTGPTPSFDTAVTAAVTRSVLAASYYLDGTKIPNGVNGPVFAPNDAWCLGAQAVVLAQPEQFATLLARTEPTYQDLTMAAAARCNVSMADQLFVDHHD